jgi:proliferating cell nuclear antigen|uniref:Proliferating cell nuclear antigen PCNA N-terminal domain-containing protein n=1 Tax=viral metagenome TaxID=1070528 RepID=A0A6C0CHD4_9ZZZZ
MANNNNYILEIKTIQASTIKSVIDAMKEILMDVNLEFDENGLKIVALDNTHIVLIHLKLHADKFEKYYCLKKLYVGINMLKFHMLIKTIQNGDILSLFIHKNDPNILGITIENNEKNVKTTYKLSMLDIDVVNVDIPPADFNTIITMPSAYLQKIIRDMHNLAEYIEIKNIGGKLILSCQGEFCCQETVLATETQNIQIKNNDNTQEIIQGVFSLKYLSIFTKCTNLCSTVEIYLKNSYPIILQYTIASMGTVKLCLAQKSED